MAHTKEQLRALIAAGTEHSNATIRLAAALLAAELRVALLAELVLKSMAAEAPAGDWPWPPEYDAEYSRRAYDRLYMATLQDEDIGTMIEHLAATLEANC